jgi:AcrR family transcriptional regulator
VLLDAGRAYVQEHPLGEPLDHVRVTDIVGRVGLSIGAVYHYWESQDDYRDDLIDLLLSPDQFPAVHRAADAVAEAAGEGASFEDLARLVAGLSFEGLARSPEGERLNLALVAYGDTDIDRRLGAQAAEVSSRWADLFAEWMPAYGLEPRPPFTYESIAVVLMALVEGMHLRRTIDPGAVTGEVTPGWDLFASAALAFVLAASRPATARADPAQGDRTLLDLATRLVPRRTPDR